MVNLPKSHFEQKSEEIKKKLKSNGFDEKSELFIQHLLEELKRIFIIVQHDKIIILAMIINGQRVYFSGDSGIWSKKFLFTDNIDDATEFTQRTLNEFLMKI